MNKLLKFVMIFLYTILVIILLLALFPMDNDRVIIPQNNQSVNSLFESYPVYTQPVYEEAYPIRTPEPIITAIYTATITKTPTVTKTFPYTTAAP